ncbi:HEAT repeat domain-containing protein [Streptosporangium sp. G11]|uniref:HEAT repeat domain-containing protein n=1 Tax=Streptosporangium sp. G11 TaxID=3436926 RepID=UPI003EBEF29A
MTDETATENFLRSTVVALEFTGSHSSDLGTGFFVAPRIVATCAHVLGVTRGELPEAVTGTLFGGNRKIVLEPVPAWFHGADLDLAFLWAPEEPDAPPVLLSPEAETGDPLIAYGHPMGRFRGGQSATFHYAGPSRLADELWTPYRVLGTPVSGGYSGSPVLNRRTGAVCGMLCLSDNRGSAHMVGAADILRHLPEEAIDAQPHESGPGNAGWLATLSDEQIRAGGWQYPGPGLRDYLKTAVRAALADPHPAPGDAGLPAVYVEQQARRAAPDFGTPTTVSATEVFGGAEHAFVFGGPGIGKSSLLRMGLVNLARDWLNGEAGPVLPVRVQATDLVDARPLPQLIASGVEADLSSVGVVNAWPPEFFGAEPMRGVRWLVLVDGLDDIVDPESRRAVVTKLGGVASGGGPDIYRFVLTSRPLPAEELAEGAGWLAGRYELRPFGRQQLRRFSERMLAGFDDTGEAAQRLMGELDRANLEDIASVPMLATMLCQLHRIDSDRRLPTDLADLYEQFVDALAGPQYVAGTRGIYAQAESAFRPYGPTAVRAVAAVLDRSVDLLARLALARHDGAPEPALDLLVAWEAANRPPQIPKGRWQKFLEDLLRRSGLVVERRGDFVFVHETIGDYLAARSMIADESRSFAAFDHLFYRWRQPWPGVAETWRQPGWRYSYTRFLIVLWPNPARTAGALRSLAERGGLAGCEFVVALLDDGVVTEPAVADAASAALTHIASVSVGHGFAARQALLLLARLGAWDCVARVMTAERSGEEIRERAAIVLAESGDTRGTDRLAAMAVNRDRDVLDRLDACVALDRLGDDRAMNLLGAVLRSLTAELGSLAYAVLPRRMGAADGTSLLVRIAEADTMPQDIRDGAARELGRRGDPRGLELLATSAGRRGIPISERLATLALLVELHDPRAARMLLSIAGNSALSGRIRLQGTMILARGGNPRVPDLLDAIVRDTRAGAATRTEAVALLADLGAKTNLVALAVDKGDRSVRADAVEALIAMADEQDTDLLIGFTRNSRISSHLRLAAAETLESLDGSVRHEERKPESKSPDSQQRARTALFVALSTLQADGLVADPHCLEALVAYARHDSVGPKVRESAADALTALGDPRGRLVTAELSPPPAQKGRILRPGTVNVCQALIRAGTEARGEAADLSPYLNLLHAMADNDAEHFYLRRYAAETLAWLGDKRGNEILADFMYDTMLSVYYRCPAAGSLARVNDARGPDFLYAFAHGQDPRRAIRREASVWLRMIGDPRAARLSRAKRRAVRKIRPSQDSHDFDSLDLALGVRAQLETASAMIDLEMRKAACLALATFRDQDNIRELMATAMNSATRLEERRQAIRSLALQGATGELSLIAEDAGSDSTLRCWAAEEAAWLGEPRGEEVLVSLVGSRSVDSYTRRRAAHFLVRLGDSRGTQLLAELATDPTTTIDARRTATQLLEQLDFAGDLVNLIMNPHTGDGARINAIDILATHKETEVLSWLRGEATLSHEARQKAAQALNQAHPEQAARLKSPRGRGSGRSPGTRSR